MPPAEPFTLTKWYLDAVGPDRRAAIGYWAALEWHGLSLRWQSVASYTIGGPPRRRRSVRGGVAPRRLADGVEWQPAALRASFRLRGAAPGIAERLWSAAGTGGEAGTVDWDCVAPVGVVHAELSDGAAFSGVGYAERLAMTVPPWRLPLRELRWGRWCDLGGTRSLVWIEWRGAEPRRWAYLDGRPIEAEVGDARVGGERFELSLADPRVLERRSFGAVVSGLPALLNLLPAAMRDLQETKWLSTGSLRCADGTVVEGRAIHEVVLLG